MSAEDLILRPFAVADEAEASAAQQELTADDFEFLLDVTEGQSWGMYVARLEEISRGENLAPDRVQADLLVAEVDGAMVGRVSIRHTIDNPFLSKYGGHIGYACRPAYRRQGYATAILRQSLARAHQLGIEQALLTCDDTNSASATIIERCGGVYERMVMFNGVPRRRYWVPTG
jgi:predicted acetyltransferase